MGPTVLSRGRGRRIGGGLLSVVAWLVLLLVAAVAVGLGRIDLHDSEQHRLDQRRHLIERLSGFLEAAYRPEDTQAQIRADLLHHTGPAHGAEWLATLRVTPFGQTAQGVQLLDRTGGTTAAVPGPTVTPAELEGAWAAALAGRPGRSGSIDVGGVPGFATVVPVPGLGFLVVLHRSDALLAQSFVQELGAIGSRGGGISWADAQGRALISWDPTQLGRVVVPAGARFPVGGFSVTRTVVDGVEQTVIGTRTARGETALFTQSTDALFGDLRAQQHERDVVLLSVLATAGLAIAASYLWRVGLVRRSRRRAEALLASSMDLVVVTSPQGVVRFASPSLHRVLGVDPASWEGRDLVDLVHPDDAERLAALVADPSAGSELDVRLHVDPPGPAGRGWYDVEAGVLPAHVEGGGVLLTWHGAGERRALRDALVHQAHHDALTGLARRSVLIRRLEEIATQDDPRAAVLFVDLDRFTPVNDTLGHDVGDAVLRAVGERLEAAVRGTDLVARFGGDEFAVLLHPADPARAREVADRLVGSLARPLATGTGVDDGDVTVGASIGIAWAGAGSDPNAVLAAADRAMYRSKAAGGGRATEADDEPDHDAGPAVTVPSSRPPGVDAPAFRARVGRFVPLSPARPPGRRRSWRPASATVVAVLAFLATGGVVVRQAEQARDQAQSRRLAERLSLVERVADYGSQVSDRSRLTAAVTTAPWRLDGKAEDHGVLGVLGRSVFAGRDSLLVLSAPDGRVLAAQGRLTVDRTTPEWRAALTGRTSLVPLTELAGSPRAVYYVPVVRGGRTAAVLVIAQSLRASAFQELLRALGSLGLGSGGTSSVDADGYATYSWDPALIGTRLIDPVHLRGLTPGVPREVTAVRPGTVTIASVIPATAGTDAPRYSLFQQPTDVFYGDLLSMQITRLLALLALIGTAVVLLTRSHTRREATVRDDARRLDALLENAHDVVLVIHDRRTMFASSAVTGLLGLRREDWLGRPAAEFVHPQDVDRLRNGLARPVESTVADVRLQAADGSYRWFDVRIAAAEDHPGIRGRVLTGHEVGVRRALQEELAHRARHDLLTGLPNRAAFDADAVRTDPAGSGVPTEVEPYSVLFVDLDRFTQVNDTYGHDTGDVVLTVLAERLRANLRKDDVVYRIGGDEFVLVLRGTGDPVAVAEDLLHRLRRPIPLQHVPGRELAMDATIGIFTSGGVEDLHTALRMADAAMYRGKEGGRGRTAVSQQR